MSNINKYIFRGYDIRGIVGEDLTEETVSLIAKSYGTFLHKRRIYQSVIGYDNRVSSKDFSAIFRESLASTGINVIDIGLSLTQIVYFAQYFFQSNGAVMITASHNPANYNGFKLANGFSRTLEREEINEIRAVAESGKFVSGRGHIIKKDIIDDYYSDILKRFKLKKLNMKIVIDASNGTAGAIIPPLLKRIGVTVIERNCTLDGTFPNGTPDPTDKKIANRLAKAVIQEEADLGFSYDADGDRLGIVDNKGRVIWNDILIAIFAISILERLPGAKIIYNTLSSKLVDEVIKKHKGQPILWKVGHSFIKSKIAQEKAPFGGELSGHFFFADNFYGHDDGAFSSFRILEYLNDSGLKLSEVIDKMPKYISTPEIKLGCPDEIKRDVLARMIKKVKQDYSTEDITDIDGVRVDFPDGMFTLRTSENGPYFTIRFESKTPARYETLRMYLLELVNSFSEIDWAYSVNIESLTNSFE